MKSFFPTLVLNADYNPLSYYPLSLWSWQDTIKAVFLDRVNIVAEYDSFINSPNHKIKLPSIIALKDFIILNRDPAFTRFNIFLRDNFTCQYCGITQKSKLLTIDHIIPKSRGGKTNWKNVVTACRLCNFNKGNKLIAETTLKLKKMPKVPSQKLLMNNGKDFPPSFLHVSWKEFLHWV